MCTLHVDGWRGRVKISQNSTGRIYLKHIHTREVENKRQLPVIQEVDEE